MRWPNVTITSKRTKLRRGKRTAAHLCIRATFDATPPISSRFACAHEHDFENPNREKGPRPRQVAVEQGFWSALSEIPCPDRGEAVPHWLFQRSAECGVSGVPRLQRMANRTAKTCAALHAFNTALGEQISVRSSRLHASQNSIPMLKLSLQSTGRSRHLTETGPLERGSVDKTSTDMQAKQPRQKRA